MPTRMGATDSLAGVAVVSSGVKIPPRGITLNRQNSIGGGALLGGGSFIGPTTLTTMSLQDRLAARRSSTRRQLSVALNGTLGPGLALAAATAGGLHLQRHLAPSGLNPASSLLPFVGSDCMQHAAARDDGKAGSEKTVDVEECEETVCDLEYFNLINCGV